MFRHGSGTGWTELSFIREDQWTTVVEDQVTDTTEGGRGHGRVDTGDLKDYDFKWSRDRNHETTDARTGRLG